MKISGLKLEQWMKVEVANMTFKSNGVISIGGENGSGKSSLWAFLLAAFKGKVELPDKPVRNKGAKQALGTITLDGEGRTAFVEVEVGEDRDMKVNVRQKDGPRFKSPATMLKALVNSFSFDPFSIMKLRGREQRDTLLQCLAVNFDDLEEEAEKIKEQRSVVSRDVAGRQRQLDHMEAFPNAPAEETSASALAAELQRATARNANRKEYEKAVEEWTQEGNEAAAEIVRLQDALKAAHVRLASAKTNLAEVAAVLDKLTPIDTAPLTARLAEVDEVNRKVRANQARAALEIQFKKDHARFAELGEDLKAIDAEKQQRLAKAKAPVDGLEFTDDGVLFNGLPLNQDSGSGQMIRAVELVAALNPELRTIFIDDAERLMLPRLKELDAWAAKNDYQVLCFRASTGGECEFLMVDGKAVENG
jgi:energy-coupling factor transporter ATP-binding protein EcfA2